MGLTLDPVTGDNLINAQDAAAGVTLTGQADPGATVRVDLGSNSLVTQADDQGHWALPLSNADLATIGQGTGKPITAVQIDAAGNASAPVTQTLTLDTLVPATPTIDVVARDDVIDATEKAAGITITGTNELGATVRLQLGSQDITPTVTGSTWSYQLTGADFAAMGEGGENLFVRQTDAAGNVSTEAVRAIDVHTLVPPAPTISTVAPLSLIHI